MAASIRAMSAADPVTARPERPLPLLLRVALVPWNLLMTAACFTMFTWIVHDRRMPGWPDVLDRVERGALVDLAGHRLAGAVVVDALLFAAFGVLHAGFARRAVSAFLSRRLRLVHKQALRTCFMTVTAVSWLALVLLWQHTGATVWDLRPELSTVGIRPQVVDTYGPLVPFAFVLLCVATVLRHGPFSFTGLRQLLASPERTDEVGAFRSAVASGAAGTPPTGHGLGSSAAGPPPVLLTTGIYGKVRHPMYLYLLASVVVRPVLSLDLAVWFGSAAAFLWIALPYEEEKLVAAFGQPYVDYRRRTPAFIPFWPTRRVDARRAADV